MNGHFMNEYFCLLVHALAQSFLCATFTTHTYTHIYHAMTFSNVCNTCVCVCILCTPRSIHIAIFTDMSLELIDKRNFLKYTLKLVFTQPKQLPFHFNLTLNLLPSLHHADDPIYSTFLGRHFSSLQKCRKSEV